MFSSGRPVEDMMMMILWNIGLSFKDTYYNIWFTNNKRVLGS